MRDFKESTGLYMHSLTKFKFKIDKFFIRYNLIVNLTAYT